MQIRTFAGLTLAGATLLAACGGGGSTATPAAASNRAARARREAATVGVRTTRLGDVLVDARGRTLYGFANDTAGSATCTGACAVTWPPFTVTADWTSGTGLERATFHTVASGAQAQLVAGRWPLYTFAGDHRPGDVTGQGVESFFVVRPDGSLDKRTTTPRSTPTPTAAPATSGGGY
jgi:predicted lipoprotein with Yx(FWY)xxD motif